MFIQTKFCDLTYSIGLSKKVTSVFKNSLFTPRKVSILGIVRVTHMFAYPYGFSTKTTPKEIFGLLKTPFLLI